VGHACHFRSSSPDWRIDSSMRRMASTKAVVSENDDDSPLQPSCKKSWHKPNQECLHARIEHQCKMICSFRKAVDFWVARTTGLLEPIMLNLLLASYFVIIIHI
jgi:hypothetical protein